MNQPTERPGTTPHPHQQMLDSAAQLQNALNQLAGMLAEHRKQVRALAELQAHALAQEEVARIRRGAALRPQPPA